MLHLSPTSNRTHNRAGFTLVELIVSVSIFSVVVLVAVGTLLVLVEANGRAQQMTEIMTNVSFAIDNMSRNIRTGFDYYCDSSTGNGNLPNGTRDCSSGTRMIFTDSQSGERWGYRLNQTTGRLEQKKESSSWLSITSNDVFISTFYMSVDGSGTFVDDGDVLPAVASFVIEGYALNEQNTDIDFTLQSRLTQRLLE